MDTNPNLYSKSETRASIDCRREQNKLSTVISDLDKIHRAKSRVLATHRKRFILDRRRSLGNVYSFQIKGVHAHRRIRRKRRDSVPEVVDIFRRQEERRRSLQALEMALSQDAIYVMDQKYQEALSRNRSDIDEEDALLAPNVDIDGPDYEDTENGGKKTAKKNGGQGKGRGHAKIKEKREGDGEEKDSGKAKKTDHKDHRKTNEKREEKARGTTEEGGGRNHRKTMKTEREREEKDHTDQENRETEQRKTEEKKTSKEHRDKHHESSKKTETDTDKNGHRKTKKTESENNEKDHKKTKKRDDDKDEKHHERTKRTENRKDETDHEKLKKKDKDDKDHIKTREQKAEPSNSSSQRPKTSKTRKTGVVVSGIPQPKQSHIRKIDTRYEDRNYPHEDDCRYREDSNERRIVPYHSNGDAHRSPSPVETQQAPRRKRSHSDGNIFMNLLELEETLRQTYELSKAAAEAAAEAAEAARRSDDDSEDDLRMSFQRQAWAQTRADDFSGSQSFSDTSENDTSDVEIDVPESPWARQRQRGEISFNYTAPDVSDVRWQMHDRDVSNRLSDAARRRCSYPRTDEIRLSPSLQRRLAGVGHHSPRHRHARNSLNYSPSLPRRRLPDVNHSPSPPRRRADASCSPTMTRRRGQADVSHLSPKATRRIAMMPQGERDSPTRWRKRDDMPKPIFQQGEMEKQVLKRRPLRRSRSEAVDVSALVTVREREGGLGVNVPRAGRRGSDSIQGLSTARMGPSMPQSWNSLLFGLALSAEEKEDIARHKRRELVASLRKRQEEVDGDVSRRIRTFLQRYEEV